MASNNLDQQPEEKLVTDIKLIKNQLLELRTLQLQGKSAVPVYQYDRLDLSTTGPFTFTKTVAAGSLAIQTIALRHTQQDVSTSNWNRTFEPSISVWVDSDDPHDLYDLDPLAWPQGRSLTTGQKKLMVSIVRDWSYGLTPQDPQNNDVYHVQLYNLDSASHTYYCHFRLYGMAGADPFTELIP